jgi:hypothetical protein
LQVFLPASRFILLDTSVMLALVWGKFHPTKDVSADQPFFEQSYLF